MRNLLCLLSLLVMSIQAQNPFVTHMFTADPTARVFNDTLFVYPSHDVSACEEGQGDNGYCMPDYHVFFTTDLVNWTDHGLIVSQEDVPWVKPNAYGMWAPDCIEKNGAYYHFYPAIPKDGSSFRRIGVAVADKPTGPFTPRDSYLEAVKGFDPGLFKDDDGRVYLYFIENHVLSVVEMNNDMTDIIGDKVDIPMPDGYKEGPFAFKRNGKYYFTFAHVPDRDGIRAYEIGYAMGDSPMGPFTYQGTVMPRVDFYQYDTNHASFVEWKGQWYIFYHHWSLSASNRLRSIRADEIEFNADGTIIQKEATIRGVGIPKAGDKIQLDRYNEIHNAKVSKVEGLEPAGFHLDYIQDGSWVRFNNVNFADGDFKTFSARVATPNEQGKIEVRVASTTGQLLATIPISSTCAWHNYKTFKAKASSTVEGIQDIVCIFKGESEYLYNVNWIMFE